MNRVVLVLIHGECEDDHMNIRRETRWMVMPACDVKPGDTVEIEDNFSDEVSKVIVAEETKHVTIKFREAPPYITGMDKVLMVYRPGPQVS